MGERWRRRSIAKRSWVERSIAVLFAAGLAGCATTHARTGDRVGEPASPRYLRALAWPLLRTERRGPNTVPPTSIVDLLLLPLVIPLQKAEGAVGLPFALLWDAWVQGSAALNARAFAALSTDEQAALLVEVAEADGRLPWLLDYMPHARRRVLLDRMRASEVRSLVIAAEAEIVRLGYDTDVELSTRRFVELVDEARRSGELSRLWRERESRDFAARVLLELEPDLRAAGSSGGLVDRETLWTELGGLEGWADVLAHLGAARDEPRVEAALERWAGEGRAPRASAAAARALAAVRAGGARRLEPGPGRPLVPAPRALRGLVDGDGPLTIVLGPLPTGADQPVHEARVREVLRRWLDELPDAQEVQLVAAAGSGALPRWAPAALQAERRAAARAWAAEVYLGTKATGADRSIAALAGVERGTVVWLTAGRLEARSARQVVRDGVVVHVGLVTDRDRETGDVEALAHDLRGVAFVLRGP